MARTILKITSCFLLSSLYACTSPTPIPAVMVTLATSSIPVGIKAQFNASYTINMASPITNGSRPKGFANAQESLGGVCKLVGEVLQLKSGALAS